MFCAECGKPVAANAKHCVYCGTPVGAAEGGAGSPAAGAAPPGPPVSAAATPPPVPSKNSKVALPSLADAAAGFP